MSKTSKAPNEHEPRTRKRKIEEERLSDVEIPPRAKIDTLRTEYTDDADNSESL